MARGKRKKAPKLEELPEQPDPTAPIDGAQLLAVARPLLDRLRQDLGARADSSPGVTAALKARHAEERTAERTADSYAIWRDGLLDAGGGGVASVVRVRADARGSRAARARASGRPGRDGQPAAVPAARAVA